MANITDFNSRTSCEVRRGRGNCTISRRLFQLTHLLRGATGVELEGEQWLNFNSRTSCEVRLRLRQILLKRQNFNSRTSCEVRLFVQFDAGTIQYISTHAPLARCDLPRYLFCNLQGISTHAPLARCDSFTRFAKASQSFQLTHLLRGATIKSHCCCVRLIFQLTHLLRGATQP